MNFMQNYICHFSLQFAYSLYDYLKKYKSILKKVRNLLESIVYTLLTYVRESIKDDLESNRSTIRCAIT